MANSVITNYLADPSVPVEKRKKIAEAINSGDLTEGMAVQGITQKYGDKYRTEGSTTEQGQIAGDIAKGVTKFARNPLGAIGEAAIQATPMIAKKAAEMGSRLTPEDVAAAKEQGEQMEAARKAKNAKEAETLQGLNKRGYTPDVDMPQKQREDTLMALKRATPVQTATEALTGAVGGVLQKAGETAASGLLTGAEGIEKVGAAVTGDTSGLEGFKQFYGLKTQEQAGQDIRQLSPAERGQIFGEGLTKFVAGTLESAFSPITGVAESNPYTAKAMELVGETMGAVSGEGSKQLKNVIKGAGIQLNSEQEAVIDEGMNNILNLMLLKTGENMAKVKRLEATKADIQAKVPEMIKSGDLAGAQALLDQYTQAIATKTTATGRIGAAAAEGAGKVARAGLELTGEMGRSALENLRRISPDIPKAIDKLESDYSDWAAGTKPGVKRINKALQKTEQLNQAGSTGKTPQRVLAEKGIIPDVEGTKFRTAEQANEIRAQVSPLQETMREAIKKAEKVSPPTQMVDLEQQAINLVRTKENIANGTAAKLEARIKAEFDTYNTEFGAEIPLSVVNDIKTARWKPVKWDATDPLSRDVNYAIAKAAQKTIEDTASKVGLKEVKQLNRDIGDQLEAAKFIESLDGNTIKGGRLSKYIYTAIGSGVGAKGGVIGSVVGALGGNLFAELLMKAEVAGPLKRAILERVRQVEPESLQAVQKWLESPEAKQGLLPAPKEGAPQSSVDLPMNLPERSQSTIEATEQARIQAQIQKRA